MLETTPRTTPGAASPDLQLLADSFALGLRAQNKSPRTITGYLEGVRLLDDYLRAAGMPRAVLSIRREHVEAFIADQVARWRPSTARTRYRSVQQLFRWLVAEGELRRSPMANTKPPAIPEEAPPVLTDEQLRRMFASCEGSAFIDRRDMAIARLFFDTGMRLAELANLRVEDVDLAGGVAVVLGKGRRPRACPFGVRTAAALDRYRRVRASHRLAGRTTALWLGHNGPMTDSGIRQALTERAKKARIAKNHPHLFRHTFAHRWLAAGHQETDLMRLMGWRSRTMLTRYAASTADERAREAHKRAALGDQL
jgi:site-specific recombinase XerD